MEQAWEYLKKLPELLNEWGSYSYALLGALLFIGVACVVVYKRFAPNESRPATLFYLGVFVIVLGIGGLAIKVTGHIAQIRAQKAWLATHRSRTGEHRLVVSNLYCLSGDETTLEKAAHEFASTLARLVGEDLPASIPPPLVVPINFSEQPSPWKTGVRQENYRDILEKLSVFQILWGDIDTSKSIARTFLGIPPDVEKLVDVIVPLKELPIKDDPRSELQFGEAYNRLLGYVALGVVLQTMHEAEAASGDERKRLFLLAGQQLRDMQARLVNGKDDPVLQRNLYERGDKIIAQSLVEAGVVQ